MPRRWSALAVLGPVLLALAVAPALSQPPGRGHGAERRDMELVGHDDLQGRTAYQPTIHLQRGRWIAYVGHHVFISYFNAGVRAVDVRDPYRPREAAFYIPATTAKTDERCVMVDGQRRCKVAIQTNNVEVDERGFIYLADRANTGLHIVRLTGEARGIIGGN